MKKIPYILIGLVVIVVVLAMTALYVYYQIYWPNQGSFYKDFAIGSGESAHQVSQRLKQERIIKSSFWFEVYLWLTDRRSQIKAGKYYLGPSQNIPEIVSLLTTMPPAKPEITITIPEGWRTLEIIDKLVEANITERTDLEAEIKNPTKYQSGFNFLKDVPPGNDLSGFLFPDTYRFYQDSQPEIIVRKMLNNFDKKLTEQMRQDIASQGKTIFEIMTLASIIEKEVVSDEDRAIVSGIFWQRLADNYPLESCATIAFATRIDKWRYSDLNLEVASPYNTYKNIGLPPGPICNPGLSAIKAAIYPQASDYYYFLSTPEGETIFSRTLEEHNANKAKHLESRL